MKTRINESKMYNTKESDKVVDSNIVIDIVSEIR